MPAPRSFQPCPTVKAPSEPSLGGASSNAPSRPDNRGPWLSSPDEPQPASRAAIIQGHPPLVAPHRPALGPYLQSGSFKEGIESSHSTAPRLVRVSPGSPAPTAIMVGVSSGLPVLPSPTASKESELVSASQRSVVIDLTHELGSEGQYAQAGKRQAENMSDSGNNNYKRQRPSSMPFTASDADIATLPEESPAYAIPQCHSSSNDPAVRDRDVPASYPLMLTFVQKSLACAPQRRRSLAEIVQWIQENGREKLQDVTELEAEVQQLLSTNHIFRQIGKWWTLSSPSFPGSRSVTSSSAPTSISSAPYPNAIRIEHARDGQTNIVDTLGSTSVLTPHSQGNRVRIPTPLVAAEPDEDTPASLAPQFNFTEGLRTQEQETLHAQKSEYITLVHEALAQARGSKLTTTELLHWLSNERPQMSKNDPGWAQTLIGVITSSSQFCKRTQRLSSGAIVDVWTTTANARQASMIGEGSATLPQLQFQNVRPSERSNLISSNQFTVSTVPSTSFASQSPLFSHSSTVRASPASSPTMSLDPESWKKSLIHFKSTLSLTNPIAKARLMLILEATEVNDLTYLIIHQLLCLATLNPSAIPSTIDKSPLASLAELLERNEKVDRMVIQFCAEYPMPLHQFLRDYPRAAQEELGERWTRFAQFFSRNYAGFKNQCCIRGYMPLVRELVEYMGIRSPVLQKVVFTAIMRDIWGLEISEHSRRAEQIFRRNQQNFFQLGLDKTTESDAFYSEQYMLERKLHLNIHPGSGRRLITALSPNFISSASPTTPVAHVHSGIGGIPASMNMVPSTSRVANAQASNMPQPMLVRSTATHARGSFPTQATQRPVAFRTHLAFGELQQPTMLANEQRRVMQQPSVRRPLVAAGSQFAILHSQRQAAIPTFPQRVARDSNQRPLSQYLLLPQPGYVPPQPAHPDTTRMALHLAHLREPIPISDDDDIEENPETKMLYRFVSGFVMSPKRLSRESALQIWTFDVGVEDFERIPKGTALDLGRPYCQPFVANSKTYRLRCILVGKDAKLEENEWVIADTRFPDCLWMYLNGHYLELRRKYQHGRDLPIDLSQHIVSGTNTLEVFINLPSKDTNALPYALAVEVVVGQQYETIVKECKEDRYVDKNVTLESIKRHLAVSDEDDEIAITSSNLVINLYDPLSGSDMCAIPARGIDCRHRDCFDLENFLQSRPRIKPRWPTDVDIWRCPICRADVRPVKLFVDGFVQYVIEQLRQEGRSTRAIVVEGDGQWKPKQPHTQKRETSSSSTLARPSEPPATDATDALPPKPPQEVIELSDDE